MKAKSLSFVMLVLVLCLASCSPLAAASSSGDQPTPTAEAGKVLGYQALTVDRAEAQVGVGSPIPVFITVSGSLPDTCAQIEYIEQKQEERRFILTLGTIPSSAAGCIQDSLPFRVTLPLNVVHLPGGSYTVEVNGSSTSFEVDSGNTNTPLPAAGSTAARDDIQVDGVNVEIGTGSPRPVHAIVSLSLSNTCSQIGEMRLHRDGKTYFIQFIAAAVDREGCKADSLPFRAEIPLNTVNLPEGAYEINVNGVVASFDPYSTSTGQAAETPAQPAGSFAFEGVSFALDPAVAAGASGEVLPENPGSPDGPYWEVYPKYTRISLAGYPVEHSFLEPVVAVYPVAAYRNLSPQAGEVIDQLEKLLAELPAQVEKIPSLPLMNSGQIFHSNLEYLNFQSGSGVRFLAAYSQAVDPITNRDLVYVFQGLTADRRYVVSAFLPISHPLLPADANALSPEALDRIYKDYQQYRTDTASALSIQPVESFSPGLATLDALIAALKID